MRTVHLAAAAALGLLAISAAPASAAVSGFTTANVNQRSGPSTSYPPIVVIPAGSPITIYGCLNDDSWCDIAWGGNRGWMSSSYLQVSYQSRRVPVRGYSGIPFITFNFGNYWDSHYRNRPFFSQRSKWNNFDWHNGSWKNGQGPNNPPKPPQQTGKNDNKPPFMGNGPKPPFGKGNSQKYGQGKGKGGPGQNCKWVDGKWVCT